MLIRLTEIMVTVHGKLTLKSFALHPGRIGDSAGARSSASAHYMSTASVESETAF